MDRGDEQERALIAAVCALLEVRDLPEGLALRYAASLEDRALDVIDAVRRHDKEVRS